MQFIGLVLIVVGSFSTLYSLYFGHVRYLLHFYCGDRVNLRRRSGMPLVGSMLLLNALLFLTSPRLREIACVFLAIDLMQIIVGVTYFSWHNRPKP